MQKRIVALLLLPMLACAAVSLAEESFDAFYVDEAFQISHSPASIAVMPEGGLLLAGNAVTGAEAQTAWEAAALRIEPDGAVRWEARDSTQEGFQFFRGIAPQSDGSAMTVNYCSGESAYTATMATVADGEVLAHHALADESATLFPAGEGALLYGVSDTREDSHGGIFYETYLALLDTECNEVWRRTFTQEEIRFTGTITVEGGIIAYGALEEQETGLRNTLGVAVRLDADGALRWIATSDSSGQKEFRDAVPMPGGGVMLTGSYVKSYVEEGEDTGYLDDWGIIACYDAEGALIWEKEYPVGYHGAFYAMTAVDEGFLVLGKAWDTAPSLLLFLLDERGNVLDQWMLRAEGADYVYPLTLTAAPEGIYVVAEASVSAEDGWETHQQTYIARFALSELAANTVNEVDAEMVEIFDEMVATWGPVYEWTPRQKQTFFEAAREGWNGRHYAFVGTPTVQDMTEEEAIAKATALVASVYGLSDDALDALIVQTKFLIGNPQRPEWYITLLPEDYEPGEAGEAIGYLCILDARSDRVMDLVTTEQTHG